MSCDSLYGSDEDNLELNKKKMSGERFDQATLDGWLDEDLARINDESLWKEHKKGKGDGEEVVVFVHKPKDDSFWWFKVVAPMPSATLAQAK